MLGLQIIFKEDLKNIKKEKMQIVLPLKEDH